MIGEKFNHLTITALTRHPKSGRKAWECRCVCGEVKVAVMSHLASGFIKSCGCQRGTHRESKTKLYYVWRAMRDRCDDKNNMRYGGRGITVCKRWQDFTNFKEDMISTYKPGLSIDRVNNNKGYSKSNCRWADRVTQGNNTRANVFIRFRGKRMTVAMASRLLNMNRGTFENRYFKLNLRGAELEDPRNRKYKA